MLQLVRDIYAATPAGRRASKVRVARALTAFNGRSIAGQPVIRTRRSA